MEFLVLGLVMVLTWMIPREDTAADPPNASDFLDEQPTNPLPAHAYQAWNENNAPVSDPRRACDVPGCTRTREGHHATRIRIVPGALDRWLEMCPQVGSAGIHSTSYLDGELPCDWCGAEPRPRCRFCDGNSMCNRCDEDGFEFKPDERLSKCTRAQYPYTRGDGHNVADGCGPDGCPPCTCETCRVA